MPKKVNFDFFNFNFFFKFKIKTKKNKEKNDRFEIIDRASSYFITYLYLSNKCISLFN